MGFRLFNETFLVLSMWVLLACSAAAGLGGLMLLVPWKSGIPLVTWQARVSIITNGVIASFIVAMTFGFGMMPWEKKALALRLGSIIVDLVLWAFLSSNAVRGFFSRRSHRPERAFEVIMKEATASSPAGCARTALDRGRGGPRDSTADRRTRPVECWSIPRLGIERRLRSRPLRREGE